MLDKSLNVLSFRSRNQYVKVVAHQHVAIYRNRKLLSIILKRLYEILLVLKGSEQRQSTIDSTGKEVNQKRLIVILPFHLTINF